MTQLLLVSKKDLLMKILIFLVFKLIKKLTLLNLILKISILVLIVVLLIQLIKFWCQNQFLIQKQKVTILMPILKIKKKYFSNCLKINLINATMKKIVKYLCPPIRKIQLLIIKWVVLILIKVLWIKIDLKKIQIAKKIVK